MTIYDAAMPLAIQVYMKGTNGCCLHVTLDDRNTEDASVYWCLERAVAAHHYDCEALALLLLLMLEEERDRFCEEASTKGHAKEYAASIRRSAADPNRTETWRKGRLLYADEIEKRAL